MTKLEKAVKDFVELIEWNETTWVQFVKEMGPYKKMVESVKSAHPKQISTCPPHVVKIGEEYCEDCGTRTTQRAP